MALTPQQMDAKMDEHFAFEAGDNIDGVLATLTDNVEHDIVGWPFGPSRDREVDVRHPAATELGQDSVFPDPVNRAFTRERISSEIE